MTLTPEQISAFADGQLDGAERTAIEAAIAADPELARQVAAHRALRQKLGAHFAPIAESPVPDHLAALLRPQAAPVIDLAAERARRRPLPRWTWLAGPALAASLALVVTLAPRSDPLPGYADQQLASALDSQLVAEQPADAPTRVLLSFRNAAGSYCRAFATRSGSGIACRDEAGWKLRAGADRASRGTGEYRQAGSEAAIMQEAQNLAAGAALDSDEERAARDARWTAAPPQD